MTLETHAQRVAWTQACFVQSPPERLPPGQRQFGCFSCDPPDTDGMVRIHFTNRDADGIGPLSRTKIETRRQELQAMFTYVQQTYAHATAVRGGSWLYHLEAYRRLFPPVYGDSREVLEGISHFQGTSSWGQFLDHREGVKPALREQFLENPKSSIYIDCGRSSLCQHAEHMPLCRRSMTFIISTQPSNHRKMYYLHTGVERTCRARDTNPIRAPAS